MKQLLLKFAKKIRDYLCSVIALCDSFLILYSNKKICILVSNGGNSGAPLVLLEAASVYKKNGYYPIIIAESHSRMSLLCKQRGIKMWNVIYFSNLIKQNLIKVKIEFCLVNTVMMYEWVCFFETFNYPIIWWIHEGNEYFEMVKNKLPSKLNDNILVLTVGMRPFRALKKYGFHYNPKILMYGTEDLALKDDIGNRTSCEELNVMIIGAICKRKNQINTIKSILSFPEEIRKKFHFLVVGTPLGGENEYFKEFMVLIKNNSLFEYLGYVERKDIPKLYRKIDAVLACSIDDPLPVVVTESLMFGKISIVSSEVGQYPYIINGSNGFKYNVFNTAELEDVLIASYENKRNLAIAENGRATFKKYFSMDSFAANLLSYTQTLMEKL